MPLRDIEGFDVCQDFEELGEIHGDSITGTNPPGFSFGRNTAIDPNGAINLRGLTTSPNKLIFGPYAGSSYEYWTVGFALSILFVEQNTEYPILEFCNTSGENLLTLNVVSQSSSSSIKFRASVGGTDYETTLNYLFGSKAYRYVEIQVRLNSSLGQITVRLDEQTIINQSGINTLNASGTGNKFVLIGQTEVSGETPILPPTLRVDDLYIKAGSSLESFEGDVAVLGTYPTTNNVSGWTPLNGANYQNVDELNRSDGDQSFVSASDNLKEDRYLINPLPINYGNPIAVQFHSRKRLSSTGSRTFKFRYRNTAGGTVAAAPATHTVDITAYKEFRELLLTNPDTAGSWTLSAVNNGSFGYRLES